MATPDLPTLSVVGAVLVHDGRILACRRGPDKDLAGRWEFPGGKIEPGESPQDALRREIAEELGVRIAVKERAGRASTRTPGRVIDLDCYWASCPDDIPTTSTDHDHLAWLDPAEL